VKSIMIKQRVSTSELNNILVSVLFSVYAQLSPNQGSSSFLSRLNCKGIPTLSKPYLNVGHLPSKRQALDPDRGESDFSGDTVIFRLGKFRANLH
jgi:hypothetical protein